MDTQGSSSLVGYFIGERGLATDRLVHRPPRPVEQLWKKEKERHKERTQTGQLETRLRETGNTGERAKQIQEDKNWEDERGSDQDKSVRGMVLGWTTRPEERLKQPVENREEQAQGEKHPEEGGGGGGQKKKKRRKRDKAGVSKWRS